MPARAIRDCIQQLEQISDRLNNGREQERPLPQDDELLACLRKIQEPIEKRLAEKKQANGSKQ